MAFPVSDSARPQVVLYSRAGCQLCDEAMRLLRDFGIEPQQIDIDADPQLRDRYGTCVPVIVWNGRERFRGRVSKVLLRRLLRREYD